MRKVDWTDYRDALAKHDGSDEKAVSYLSRTFPHDDVMAAQKAWKEKSFDQDVKAAMNRQNSPLTSGDPNTLATLEKNGQAVADLIRAGGKNPQQ